MRSRPPASVPVMTYKAAVADKRKGARVARDAAVHHGLRIMVIFEGRDTAGKGGTIKRITERLNAALRHERRDCLEAPCASS